MPNLSMRRGEVTQGFLLRRLTLQAEDNKENMVGTVRRQRKSPLPEWYPRTPLRDITGIVNVLERRKIRLQAAEVIRERVTDQTPLPNSTPTTTKWVLSSSSPVEHPLPTPSTSSTSSSPINQCPTNMPQKTDAEEKLCRLIDQIERIVRKNLKRMDVKKEALDKKRAMQRTTLMSMR